MNVIEADKRHGRLVARRAGMGDGMEVLVVSALDEPGAKTAAFQGGGDDAGLPAAGLADFDEELRRDVAV